MRHIMSHGFGRYSVIEGHKLNAEPLDRETAQKLATAVVDDVEAESELERSGIEMDAAAARFRVAYDKMIAHTNEVRSTRPGVMPTGEMFRLNLERSLANHLRGTVLRSPYGPPADAGFNFATVTRNWQARIAAASPSTPTPRRKGKIA